MHLDPVTKGEVKCPLWKAQVPLEVVGPFESSACPQNFHRPAHCRASLNAAPIPLHYDQLFRSSISAQLVAHNGVVVVMEH